MSEKVRRQKDIIKNATKSYLDATSVYQDYFEGSSPVSITYYQIADEASRTDSSLDNTHEVIGSQSSIYYYRIKNITVYGIQPLEISTQLAQNGVVDFISGDFIMTPDLQLRPRSGEFFSIEDDTYPDLPEHLFQITDVQYDKPTNNKYHKCSWKLYPKNTDTIQAQVVKKFIYDPNGKGNSYGVGDSVLITEEEAAEKESINNLVDGLIDKYKDLFYNGAMDTFTYQKPLDSSGNNFEYYWCPYTCHFIYKNKILEKIEQSFLDELFVQDVNETSYPGVYNEAGYRKCIYGGLEVNDPETIESLSGSFMEISTYDLNKPLNLPFFSSAEKYKLIEVNHKFNPDFWLGAFNWMYGDEEQLYSNIDSKYFFKDDASVLSSADKANNDTPFTKFLKTNVLIKPVYSNGNLTGDWEANPDKIDDLRSKIYYGLKDMNDKTSLKSMWLIYADTSNNDDNITDFSAINCDITSVLSDQDITEKQCDYLFLFIRDYLFNSLVLNETTMKKLNNYFYENSMRTYLLLPIVIFILQNYKGE